MKVWRTRPAGDDEGSTMLVTVMVMVIVASMLMVAAAVYIAEADLTGKGKKSSVAIMSARSGVATAVAALRAARPSDDKRFRKTKFDQGDASKLPCGAQPEGSLGGSHPGAKFNVVIDYYNQDPGNRDKKWRQANKLKCLTTKTIDPTIAKQATYVLITSKGTNQGAERVVESVRSLAKLDIRDLGGLVRVRDGQGEQLCWTAPPFRSGLPSGQYVTAETCYDKATSLTAAQKEALKERQMWERRSDNRVMLTFSNDDPAKKPLCLESNFSAAQGSLAGGNWGSSSGERYRNYQEQYKVNRDYYDSSRRRWVSAGTYVWNPPEDYRVWSSYRRAYYNDDYRNRTPSQASVLELKECSGDVGGERRTRQHFYTEGGHQFRPIDFEPRHGTSGHRCLKVALNLTPRLVMGAPCHHAQWFRTDGQEIRFVEQRMEGPVGPGGVDTSDTEVAPGEVATGAVKERKEREFMLVNYRMMGSCFDVERSWISMQRMIVYPCHVHAFTQQNAYKNQTFFYNKTTKVLYTDMKDVSPVGSFPRQGTNGPWCMTLSNTTPARVIPSYCDPNRPPSAKFQWEINGIQDDPAKSFTVVNVANGMCMQGAHGRDGSGIPLWAERGGAAGQFTEVIVAKCDGSQLQRWNYEAQVSRHGERGFREVKKGS